MKVKVNSSGLSVLNGTVGCIGHDYGTGIVTFLSDGGLRVNLHKSHLVEIDDTPQIEVGSEWVARLAKQGEKTLVVLHVGQQMSLCKWVADNREFLIKNTEFNTAYKPKPKTVTMYFYNDGIGGIMAYSHKTHAPLLFTKEIEL